MIDAQRLRSLLHYDRDTGIFTWLESRGGRWRGDVAGHRKHDGYVYIRIDKVTYVAHRLAWLYVTGEWPRDLIDHKDCDGYNNVFDNLREADRSQNGMNIPKRPGTSSSFKGVTWLPDIGKWQASITARGKHHYLGCFPSEIEAAAAYADAAKRLHGEFVNLESAA